MSLFVAIKPPERAREDLHDAIDRVRKPLTSIDLHWQPVERWHVTMAFLGDQDDEADEAVAACVDEVAASTATVQLALGGAGSFGRQVLWIGIRDDTAGLSVIARTLHSRLRAARFPVEKRPWHPHLTVARTRGTDARPAVRYLEGYMGPEWELAELIVIRSEGGPNPRHTVIHSAAIASP